MKKNFLTFSFLFLFFLMLAYPAVTKQAAHNGLQLWIFTVLPALLPYTIISSLLLSLNAFSYPCKILGHFLRRKLPEYEIFTIICGCLCGCPIGAKVAADSYRAGHLKRSTAEFLMCAFNNISPSFLINYVFYEVYSPFIRLTNIDRWIFFTIMLISSVLGTITVCVCGKKITYIRKSPTNTKSQLHSNYDYTKTQAELSNHTPVKQPCTKEKTRFLSLFDNCILSAFEIQVKIGSYIILFAIINNLFLYTLHVGWLYSSIFGSVMEVTSGLGLFITYKESNSVELLSLIPCFISALTTFGGLCTVLQTKTVISGTDLSISRYIFSKSISAILAFSLTYVYICI